MLDATIYIPTYKRVNKQRTWKWLSDEWRERAVLVCTPEEEGPLNKLGYDCLPCPETGIGNTRQWVLDQHHLELDGEWLIMMDDDLQFSQRRTDDPSKFTKVATGAVFNEMMEAFGDMMQHVMFGGISNRSGANYNPEPWRLNARIHDLMALHVPTARKIDLQLNRMRFMEDFDAALQVLTKGYPTLSLNSYVKDDIGGSNAPGGCSEYRTSEGQAEAARLMLERWGSEIIRLTTKPGWNGDMAGERTDVAVQWAKAFKQGVEQRELLGVPQEELPDLVSLI